MKNSYLKIIHSLAWKYSFITGCDVDDLVSVAYVAFYENQHKFDEKRGAQKSSFLYSVFKNAMLVYANKQTDTECPRVEDDASMYEPVYFCTPERTYQFKESIMGLSDDSKAIVQMIFSNPIDFIEQGKPKKSRGHVYRELRNRGWSWGRIWNSFDEIKAILN
jgi:DNA-directed RNA polymerase specialized sigma24 family protein